MIKYLTLNICIDVKFTSAMYQKFYKEDGIRQLITCFLNLIMEEEALLQADAQRYERIDSHKSRNQLQIHNSFD